MPTTHLPGPNAAYAQYEGERAEHHGPGPTPHRTAPSWRTARRRTVSSMPSRMLHTARGKGRLARASRGIRLIVLPCPQRTTASRQQRRRARRRTHQQGPIEQQMDGTRIVSSTPAPRKFANCDTFQDTVSWSASARHSGHPHTLATQTLATKTLATQTLATQTLATQATTC